MLILPISGDVFNVLYSWRSYFRLIVCIFVNMKMRRYSLITFGEGNDSRRTTSISFRWKMFCASCPFAQQLYEHYGSSDMELLRHKRSLHTMNTNSPRRPPKCSSMIYRRQKKRPAAWMNVDLKCEGTLFTKPPAVALGLTRCVAHTVAFHSRQRQQVRVSLIIIFWYDRRKYSYNRASPWNDLFHNSELPWVSKEYRIDCFVESWFGNIKMSALK